MANYNYGYPYYNYGYPYGRAYNNYTYGIGATREKIKQSEQEQAATPKHDAQNQRIGYEIDDLRTDLRNKTFASSMAPLFARGAMGQIGTDTMLGLLTGSLLGVMMPKWFGGGGGGNVGGDAGEKKSSTPTKQTPTSVTPPDELPELSPIDQMYLAAGGKVDPINGADTLSISGGDIARAYEVEEMMRRANSELLPRWAAGYSPSLLGSYK